MVLLKRNSPLGTVLFGLMALASLIRVMVERPISGHYQLFTEVSRYLWNGRDPYGVDFHHAGLWFYSPACGMFFFSLFAYLPMLFGLFLYSLISIATLYFSILYFLADFKGKTLRDIRFDSDLQWALAFSSIPLFQAVIAAKVETIMMSIILFSIVQWRKEKFLLSSILLGMALNWKFQPAPMAALVGIVLLIQSKSLRSYLSLGISFLLWTFLPALFLGFKQVLEFSHHQQVTLGAFIQDAYSGFDNIFRFLNQVGHGVSFQDTLILSAGFAVLYGAIVILNAFRGQREGLAVKDQILIALSLGSAFCVGFSPLGQNNASILGLPILLLAVQVLTEKRSRLQIGFTIFFLAVFLFSYSDLVPEALRIWLRSYSIKSVVAVIYASVMAILFVRTASENRTC